MTVVLDASVLLKWFVKEPGADAALDVKRRYLITADAPLSRAAAKFVRTALLR